MGGQRIESSGEEEGPQAAGLAGSKTDLIVVFRGVFCHLREAGRTVGANLVSAMPVFGRVAIPSRLSYFVHGLL